MSSPVSNSSEKRMRAARVLSAAAVCLFALTGIALTVLIYLEGTREGDSVVFSPERVGAYALYLLAPLYLLILFSVMYGIVSEGKGRSRQGRNIVNGMRDMDRHAPAEKEVRIRRTVLICLAVFFTGLLVTGAYLGGAVFVLKKAITICSECLGLG